MMSFTPNASVCGASAQGGPLESSGPAAGMYLDVPVDGGRAVVGLLCDKESPAEPSTLSARSLADSQAEMGYGTTRPLERVMASLWVFDQRGIGVRRR